MSYGGDGRGTANTHDLDMHGCSRPFVRVRGGLERERREDKDPESRDGAGYR